LKTAVIHKEKVYMCVCILFYGSRCAYEPEKKKAPLSGVIELGHVGKSSYSIVTTITLPCGDVLMTAINQVNIA
jgi:hypothetical protein